VSDEVFASPATVRNFESVYQSLLNAPLSEVQSILRNYIVQPYSKLELIKWSDRLPALSGVATMISSRFPQEIYIAGKWQSDTIRGLQWHLDDVLDPLDRTDRALEAPSWSWASVRGAISYSQASHGNMVIGSNKKVVQFAVAQSTPKDLE
jgi:hypothetical protein